MIRFVLYLFLLLQVGVAAGWAHEKPLVARMDVDFPPYEFLDSDGQPAGYSIDLLRAVAEVSELNVEIQAGPWSRNRKELEAGTVDILTTMAPSKERERIVDFTKPHVYTSIVIFSGDKSVAENFRGLKDQEIVVQRDDIAHDDLRKRGYQGKIVPVDYQIEALQMVAAGRDALAIVSKEQALYLIHKHRMGGLYQVAPYWKSSTPYCFAVPEGRKELLASLNNGLKILKKSGRDKEIYEKWFGAYDKGWGVEDLIRFALWTITPLTCLVLTGFIWSWTLQRKVAQKTEELKAELLGRQSAEAALDVERQFRQLLESSPVPMCVTSREGRILFLNPEFFKQFGYSLEDVETLDTLCPVSFSGEGELTGEMTQWSEIFSLPQAKRQSLEESEADFRRKNGDIRRVVFRAATIDKRVIVVFNDITERKIAEEELKSSNRELEAFAYTVSHDLRSPLTPIIGYAQFLRENYKDSLDDQGLNCLAEIEKQGEKMLALMEDLLNLAKAGFIERPAEPVDLNRVLLEILTGLDEQISKSGLSVSVSAVPEVRIPETLLHDIFENLIVNALRYAASEGGTVEVGGSRNSGKIRYYVRDHGPGIALDERERVFEVFYRGVDSKKAEGTGIGLATVRKIIKSYGGKVWVDETPGGGSTFRLEFSE